MPAQPGFVTRFILPGGLGYLSLWAKARSFPPGETEFHTGIDFGGKPQGTPVETPAQGIIRRQKLSHGMGGTWWQ